MHLQLLQVNAPLLSASFKRRLLLPPAPSALPATLSLPPAFSVGDVAPVPASAQTTSYSTKRLLPASTKSKHAVKNFLLAACLLKFGILDFFKCFPIPQGKVVPAKHVAGLSCQDVLELFLQASASITPEQHFICPLGLLHSLQGQGPAKSAFPNCQKGFKSKFLCLFPGLFVSSLL